MDETRIEPALREGPPFRTRYASRPLPLSEAGPHGSRLLALVAVTLVLVVAAGGAVLVGSGIVDPSVVPVLPDASTSPENYEGSWTATGSMLSPLDGSPVLLADGLVLVAGSYQAPAQPFAELYDPESGSWTATAWMMEARRGHTATLLPDGTVLVAGGSNGETGLASAELYDPRTGSWLATGSMLERRTFHRATLLPDGTVLVSGGWTGEPGNRDENGTVWEDEKFLASAEIYDPRTRSWTATGSMTDSRANHSATLLSDGRVLVAGGEHPQDGALLNLASAEIYDPRTGSWTETGSMLVGRAYHEGARLPEGAVLVVGGSSAEVYDPGSGSWTPTGSMISTQYGATATLLSDGTVLVAGGADCDGDPCFTSRAQLYDPRTGSWTETGSLLGVRKFHSATLLLDGTVLVTGGTDGHPGADWHRLSTAELYHPVLGN